MSIFPSSTNAAYQGSRISIGVLALAVISTLIPACIHTFLPDGGANMIANMGLDLESDHGRRVVSLFAWAGTTQLVWAAILAIILVRYRSMIPIALGLLVFERVLHAWNMWGPKGGTDHPPETYATLVMIPVFALGFLTSLKPRNTEENND